MSKPDVHERLRIARMKLDLAKAYAPGAIKRHPDREVEAARRANEKSK
jgi:hypothetical protein